MKKNYKRVPNALGGLDAEIKMTMKRRCEKDTVFCIRLAKGWYSGFQFNSERKAARYAKENIPHFVGITKMKISNRRKRLGK